VRAHLANTDAIDPDLVIMDADTARKEGLTSTVVFPVGNIAPQGSVIKATAIDASLVGEDATYRHRGPARVFTSERAAITAIKGQSENPVKAGDIIVLIGGGPSGTGMEEIAQITLALKFVPWGKHVSVLTDARFSGVSTGPCIGHIGPEALAGGPVGRLRDGDIIEIIVDRANLNGSINMVGTSDGDLSPAEADALLNERSFIQGLAPHPQLPDDTRLWAALQEASGGTWTGCIYDVDKIIETLQAGMQMLREQQS
jgi:dihydroxyacid dehydratase/phosphogluconate dehydratase